MACKLCSLIGRHFSNLVHVAFVPYKDFANARVSESLYFMHPLSNIVERISIGNIIYYYYSMSTSVIAACQSSESLLASCVPLFIIFIMYEYYNLKFDNLLIKVNSLNFLESIINIMNSYEVYSDCIEKVFIK